MLVSNQEVTMTQTRRSTHQTTASSSTPAPITNRFRRERKLPHRERSWEFDG
jgi:hypothetical protein